MASPVIVNDAASVPVSSAPNWMRALWICEPGVTGRSAKRSPGSIGVGVLLLRAAKRRGAFFVPAA